jgi:hypothetical protein
MAQFLVAKQWLKCGVLAGVRGTAAVVMALKSCNLS